ncbi:MAG TPA: cation acetate symporter [Tepidisphaeraceae bacterium]|jgi:cation/acetate symporter
MPNETSYLAIAVFLAFVGFTLGLSFWLGRKAKTAGGYFAAHGEIGWFVNGIAFAGDYLSAASFLGICGMIAFYGYDGFLYSIGFLAGWVVALFVIAEPIKRLGKYTFADALDAKFGSPGIRLAAALSTLVVSVFYLIPQMVGAGSLIKPLLGLEHHWGVVIVGGVVITIVTTAGMVSTTWVQFIKGSLLVVFCAILVVLILKRGLSVSPEVKESRDALTQNWGPKIADTAMARPTIEFRDGAKVTYDVTTAKGTVATADPQSPKPSARVMSKLGNDESSTGPLSPTAFIDEIQHAHYLAHTPIPNSPNTYKWNFDGGQNSLMPGNYFTGLRSPELSKKLDFISLMLALFCGTASLPHILIRYYTVKDAAAARKSTVVGIAAIGFFYVLTLYIGLGAMVSGNLDPSDSNMAAPLLAKTFGELPFALISAIAFTTVLGTVSGLILAAAGAVAHDIMGVFAKEKLTGTQQVKVAKIASVVVGVIAIGLGILFQHFNVTFLVGWAFNVAASANLPAIVMLLFWGRTTKQGMISSILVGCLGSVAWLLLTKEAFQNVYGQAGHLGYVPFSQPGLVTIPLSFLVLVVVSLLTRRREDSRGFDVATR